ncbi:MAG: ATP-binding protein, partial [Syntrophales bacterium LBB04]|nr:ATP-binding protein [Syntrophales bacterium LBB04]
SKGGAPIKTTIDLKKFLPAAVNFALRGAAVRSDFLIPDDLWPIEGDERQLNQAINNLIINADESMPAGGTIRVHCANISLDAKKDIPVSKGNYVKIAIEDQGTGIPEEYREKIFDPYFTTKPNGTGLGLATCHSILKKHGGHIDFESISGTGSTFTIYLPASRPNTVQARKEEKNVTKGTGRVLLMDDEAIVQEVASQMLEIIGYHVTLSREGREAIDLYRKAKAEGQPFDCVIMDLTIPGGMGGKEAVKNLLQIDPQAKVIVSSGYSNDPVMANFREYGFAAVLTKPYIVEDLRETINHLLNV